jgi:carbamoyl-phosphate synthase large subunit
MILGSGPNRIGQGIEFDYCCCHASYALQEFDHESIMVNCNPETVSTDYDTSDRLYFEPLTLEEVSEYLRRREARRRHRPVRRADAAESRAAAQGRGRPIIGTDPADIDLAEDRKLFGKLLDDLGIPSPPTATPPAPKKPARWLAASAIRCWCGPATCWADAPW